MKAITLLMCFVMITVRAQNFKTDLVVNFGSSVDDGLQSVVADDSGNLYLTGFYSGTIDVDPGTSFYNLTSNGGTDVFIVKLSPNKKIIWAKTFGGTGGDGSYKICYDQKDNIYITGVFENSVDFDPGSGSKILTSNGYYDVFVLRMKTNGDFLWAKSFGGIDDEYIKDMLIGQSSELILSGSYNGNVDFDPSASSNFLTSNNFDVFINKLDSNGNFLTVTGIGGASPDFAKCLSKDDSGNLYISGTFAHTVDFNPGAASYNLISKGKNDVFVLKLSSTGTFVWAKSFGGLQDEDVRIIKVLKGFLYIAGWNISTCDFDPGPGTINYTPVGATDFFISKFNLNGNLEWVRNAGGVGSDLIDDIISDSNGDLFLTGYFSASMKVKVSNDSINLSTIGLRDILFAKMNSSGDFKWVTSFGSTLSDFGTDILIDKENKITMCGSFSNSVNFDKNGGVKLAESIGATDVFITDFTDNSNGISLYSNVGSNIIISPNPSNGHVSISNNLQIIKSVEIYNLNGVLLDRVIFNEESCNLNLTGLDDSIYYFKIYSQNGNISYRKWIKINP